MSIKKKKIRFFRKTILAWCEEIKTWRESKGFYTPSCLESTINRDDMLGKLMLVVSEISEASEAIRNNDFDSFKEELADASIRIFDICGSMSIDLEVEISNKMIINQNRKRLHGKKTSL